MNPSLGQHGNFAKQHNKQSGAALIIFFLVLILAGSAVLFSLLDSNGIKNERNKKTAAALAEAKTALIGYAMQQATKPGTLPCTDTDNDGSANTSGTNSCAAYIGRLPWKQLGLPMLRDGDGECLWYAISPVFRNTMNNVTRIANPLNTATSGTITLVDDADTPLAGINPVIAVVIAPGAPVAGQSRSGAATIYCLGDSAAAKYLDSKGAVNNATGNVVGNNYTFKLGKIDSTFTDRFLYITANEFYQGLRKRMVKEILGNLDIPSGPVNYFNDVTKGNGTYPCPAATPTGNMDCTPPLPIVGYVPYNDPNPAVSLQYATLGSWLADNGWFAMATYSYYSPTHVKVTLADVLGSYSCDANSNVFTCSSP
jgi:hypothetical protein